MKKLSVLFICIFSFCILACSTPTTTTTETTTTITKNDEKKNDTPSDTGGQGGQQTTQRTPIPRAQWDAENIYLTNTTQVPDSTNSTFCSRQTGTSGIIGKFVNTVNVTLQSGTSQNVRMYTFYDTGYFESSEVGYANFNVNTPINNRKDGTFVLTNNNDGTFRVVLTLQNYNGSHAVWTETYNFKVSNQGLIINSAF